MAKLTKEQLELWRALRIVQDDARKQAEYARAKIGAKPLPNKTQQHHDEYWTKQLLKAEAA